MVNMARMMDSRAALAWGKASSAVEEPATQILEAIHSVLERTPPELAADIFDHGITLIGGGAQLFGLDKALSKHLKVRCRLAEDAQGCVAMGAGRAMEGDEEFGRAMFDFRQPRKYMSA